MYMYMGSSDCGRAGVFADAITADGRLADRDLLGIGNLLTGFR